ncbi:T9SS type A sorting domain-containing protein [Flavivirga algicola]|uniref:T9SS type A sorting domain-containing protein n=1 Tax=Flavivirga algicola TaxID=2729136 RepID=A0ABX1RWF1_9FLAO|nr:T9SS type A sorting domain-containing protein [Flavivirga algicola]NMH86814.1 T9SS type A sorting domain-containing protein [Flavivirga algicola]
MEFIKNYILRTILVLLITTTGFAQTTKETALNKIDELNTLITSAENQGFDATREKMSVRVAEVFLYYADRDENSIDYNETIFASQLALPKEVSDDYTDRELAELLPEFERGEVVKLLDLGIEMLTKVISGEIVREPTFNPDYTKLDVNGTRIEQDGNPVFLADWVFKPESAGSINLKEYFGSIGGAFIRPADMEKNAQDEIVLKALTKSVLEGFPQPGDFGLGFLAQRNVAVPDYIKNDYPEIEDGFSLHTGFDIDHPKAREFHADFFRLVVPLMKEGNHSKLGYLLTNEPHWNINGTWAVVDPTPFTQEKFGTWLNNKHGDVAALNALWGTNFADFAEAGNTFQTPISNLTTEGTPRWYDLVRFNQERVNEWYDFLIASIKTHDPNAKTHLKLIPTMWSQGRRTTGLDFEHLTRASTIIGNDANSANSEAWDGASVSDYWMDKYALEWRNTAMTYDFLSSILPNAINYNSESGFTGWGRFRNLFLEPSYLNAVHWFAVIQGMDIVNSWEWGRNSVGVLRSGGVAYVDMMPQTLNTTHLAMLEMTAHGEEMSKLQDMERHIRVFYSETSAINDEDYMEGEIQLIYEDLFFNGYKIGFATANILETHDNKDWKIVVIRNTPRVTVDEFNALQTYLNNGGTVIMDSGSIIEDEYGRNLSGQLTAGSGKLSVVDTANLASIAISEVQGLGIYPVVNAVETNTQGDGFQGVMHRAVQMNDGRKVIALINMGLTDATVNLSLPGNPKLALKNMVNGTDLENGFVMKPEDVLLLDVAKFHKGDDSYTLKVNGETCPDKNNGTVEITARDAGNYTATINGTDYDFIKDTTIENLTPGAYELCILNTDSNVEQCFNLTVEEGEELTAKISSIKSATDRVAIDISKGTAPFHVLVNGEEVMETSRTSFAVSARQGDNVEVKSEVACEGVVSKQMAIIDEIYPNPFSSEVTLRVNAEENVASPEISMFNILGKRVQNLNTSSVKKGNMYEINISHLDELPTGIYVVNVVLKDEVKSFKLVKN